MVLRVQTKPEVLLQRVERGDTRYSDPNPPPSILLLNKENLHFILNIHTLILTLDTQDSRYACTSSQTIVYVTLSKGENLCLEIDCLWKPLQETGIPKQMHSVSEDCTLGVKLW